MLDHSIRAHTIRAAVESYGSLLAALADVERAGKHWDRLMNRTEGDQPETAAGGACNESYAFR